MGTWASWPNFDSILQTFWGAGQEFWTSGPGAVIASGTNLVVGPNPPYALDDFASFFPKFFGLPTLVSNCATTQGSDIVTVASVAGLLAGQFIQGANLPKGSVIVGLGSGQFTVNTQATATGPLTCQVYEAAPVPVAVIQLYLRLAWTSLQSARWQEQWLVAMGLFIAHYVTLYAQSDASQVLSQLVTSVHGEVPAGAIPGTVFTLSAVPPGGVLQSFTVNGVFQTPGADYTLNGVTIATTMAAPSGASLFVTWLIQEQVFAPTSATGSQIAAQGLAGGIQTSKSVGDVSVGYQPLESLKAWGAWNLTRYGQILSTMAAPIGLGPMVIW